MCHDPYQLEIPGLQDNGCDFISDGAVIEIGQRNLVTQGKRNRVPNHVDLTSHYRVENSYPVRDDCLEILRRWFVLRLGCYRDVGLRLPYAAGLLGKRVTGERVGPGSGPSTNLTEFADPALALQILAVTQCDEER